jgi:hypothetical protein
VISMSRFRQWVGSIIEEATTVLYHDLLLGHRPRIALDTLIDCMDRRDAGFSFLEIAENQLCRAASHS